ncbi:beta strand repeat-containing protein [Hymenobacter ruricola]|uniref:Uncharacterized protein n=1 Tax=Hymenobacter ruricola TaxID=2791023 RepID=A0ABS0I112_9BACT|nr:hypothetical protein [Hymenobacter ruricola]MBF9220259.1 hypothetical protein [Hymenobacter ruricola]
MNKLAAHARRTGTLLLLASAGAYGQSVGIGTTTPNPSASLHLRAPNLGLLINQVNLASLTDATTITNPATGLLVYSASAALPDGPGFYYNAGTPAAPQWTRLTSGPASAGDNLGNHTATQNLNLQGNLLVGGTATVPGTVGLRLDGNGNAGLGTTPAPTAGDRLRVDGGDVRVGFAQWNSAANNRLLKFGDGDYVTLGEAGADDRLQFQARDFRFDGSDSGYPGNVGIGLGAAAASGERLEVGGNIKITGPAATTGLVFADGTKQFTAATGGGLTLPYSGSANPSASGPVFQITNTGSGSGLRGASASGQGVVGRVNGTGPGQGVVGVKGTNVPNIEDAAVVGLSDADYAVYARSKQETGVFGTTEATTIATAGVRGFATSGGTGVSGESSSGPGVSGSSTTNVGVSGTSGDDIGVRGSTAGDGIGVAGVVGRNTGTSSSSVGVSGFSHNGIGVFGDVDAPGGRGVQGQASQANGTAVVASASGPATAFNATTTGTGPAAYISQSNTASSAAAVTIRQRGTGPALVLDNNGAGYAMGMGLGIGTSFPRTQLSITPATTEAKITLYDGGSGTNHYGFGVSGFQLNYHVSAVSDNHVFYAGGKNGDGTELMRIKGNGRVGIGTDDPQAQLDVAGTVRAVEVNTPTTGAANLLPVAYGRIRANGTVASGTGNFTCSQTNGLYTVTFTAASGLSTANFGSAAIMATPNGSNAPIYGFAGGAGQVQFVFDPAGALDTFSFMVYQP